MDNFEKHLRTHKKNMRLALLFNIGLTIIVTLLTLFIVIFAVRSCSAALEEKSLGSRVGEIVRDFDKARSGKE